MNKNEKQKQIATINDQFRSLCGLPRFGSGIPGQTVFTCGISTLPPAVQIDIWFAVAQFDAFTPDNDPYGEHDFGSLEIEGAGKVFWKIDYYEDGRCDIGAEDPAVSCYRVLTVMLAEEY